MKDRIIDTIREILRVALASGPFGLPEGTVNDAMLSNGAMPIIDIVSAQQGQVRYNMRPDVSASFVQKNWAIAIQEKEVEKIIATADDAGALDGRMKSFADMLYHEARHCQQAFWMMALLQQHSADYEIFTQMFGVYKAYTKKGACDAAKKINIPNDNLVTTGLHRMLMFHYYWMISYMQDQAGGAYVKPDVPIAQAEVCKLLSVPPETAAKMVRFEEGYRSQLHEEVAYACAEVVQAYWDRPDRALVFNPGTCTADYAAALKAVDARS
ncbi:hypothetical protein [Burkholderia sp. JP2-270]|uniref:hypothetical protein n=1 Tax=Burkholderia sp. JP2-270 TaxID=2217913 RepID=UPI001EF8269D|nr:hypothetical protein [Burkholderia sp. JP2-270]